MGRYGHETIKPLKVIREILIQSTNEGDVVLDAFLGSGTTAVACRQTNRKYIGIEKEAEYVKIAKERLEQGNLIKWQEKDTQNLQEFQ